MSLEDRILDYLTKAGPVRVREVAKFCGIEGKSEANSALYRLKSTGKADIDANFFWTTSSLVKTRTSAEKTPNGLRPTKTTANAPSAKADIVWTREQTAIINAPFQGRLLVEAGPGTGKTAVACARVAKLLREDNLTPSSILMVSFTRTAVAEMKSRIRLWADSGRVNAVNICTLDQAAFQFGVGCGDKFEKLMGNFDDNIQATLEHFAKRNALLLEYVHGLEHVIIDEGQDLIGPRSELAARLLGSLRPEAGATIFADAAQAIFGFTTDVDGPRNRKSHFLQSFDAGAHGFKSSPLTKIHRTADPQILDLFTRSRDILTGPHSSDATWVQQVIGAARDAAPCDGDDVKNLSPKNGDLLLYRKRASALMHALWCPGLFRLRLPAHPPALFPWIGLVFSSFVQPLISRTEFNSAWKASVPAGMTDGFTEDAAWELLYRFAGNRDDVAVARLRAKLSLPRPPVEFCQLDYGGAGPIFSTIHASKGREADRVFLMLPRNLDYLEDNENMDPEEEARVFYVGSTRVRKQLLRGIAKTLVRSRRLEERSERVVQLCADDKLKFQIGLVRDFDDLAPISRETCYCSSPAAAVSHQKLIIAHWKKCLADGAPADVTAIAVPTEGDMPWPYQFVNDNKQILAWSTGSLGKDLWKMNDLVQEEFGGHRRPPSYINHLKMIGLRTRVVGDDPATLGRIHKPFADSGFCLVPMIVGFQSVRFPARNAGHAARK